MLSKEYINSLLTMIDIGTSNFLFDFDSLEGNKKNFQCIYFDLFISVQFGWELNSFLLFF